MSEKGYLAYAKRAKEGKKTWLKSFIEVSKIPVGERFYVADDLDSHQRMGWVDPKKQNIVAINDDGLLVEFVGNEIVRPADPQTGCWILTKEEKAAEKMTAALNKKTEKEMEALLNEVIGKKRDVIYSYKYSNDDHDLVINDLNDIIIKGRAIFQMQEDRWHDREYISAEVKNPTRLDVAKLADDMIRLTGDHHHVFFEGVVKTGRKIKNISVYEFSMGS